jgi:hypothetical protein
MKVKDKVVSALLKLYLNPEIYLPRMKFAKFRKLRDFPMLTLKIKT